jgi:hypothetical protein
MVLMMGVLLFGLVDTSSNAVDVSSIPVTPNWPGRAIILFSG